MEQEQKVKHHISRVDGFLTSIKKNSSPHLVNLYRDIFQSANFIKPGTMSRLAAMKEAARSQACFVATLRVGNKVHLTVGTNDTIEVGTVEEINDHSLKIKEQMGLRFLSEVRTIDFS